MEEKERESVGSKSGREREDASTHLQVIHLPSTHEHQRRSLEDTPVLDSRVGAFGGWEVRREKGKETRVRSARAVEFPVPGVRR